MRPIVLFLCIAFASTPLMANNAKRLIKEKEKIDGERRKLEEQYKELTKNAPTKKPVVPEDSETPPENTESYAAAVPAYAAIAKQYESLADDLANALEETEDYKTNADKLAKIYEQQIDELRHEIGTRKMLELFLGSGFLFGVVTLVLNFRRRKLDRLDCELKELEIHEKRLQLDAVNSNQTNGG